jgi:AraC-like DNA-binding protein
VESSLADVISFWPAPARCVTCLEFTFGAPYRIHHVDGSKPEINYPATVIGAKTYQRIRLELHGHVEGFVIVFQPTGLQRLFSLPGRVIVNEHYEADVVLGGAVAQLRSRLGEAKSFAARIQIADRFLGARIPGVDEETNVDATVREMVLREGCVRISGLASCAGVGIRQFERRFADLLGITPKLYARIVRFEAAIRKRTIFPNGNWTRIAHELGYHDQMHMIHDFQLLSAESPTSLGPHLEYLNSMAAQPQA